MQKTLFKEMQESQENAMQRIEDVLNQSADYSYDDLNVLFEAIHLQ